MPQREARGAVGGAHCAVAAPKRQGGAPPLGGPCFFVLPDRVMQRHRTQRDLPPTFLRPYTDLPPTLHRPSSDLQPTFLRHSSDLPPTFLRHSSDIPPTFLRPSSDIPPTLHRHYTDITPTLHRHYTELHRHSSDLQPTLHANSSDIPPTFLRHSTDLPPTCHGLFKFCQRQNLVTLLRQRRDPLVAIAVLGSDEPNLLLRRKRHHSHHISRSFTLISRLMSNWMSKRASLRDRRQTSAC